MGCAASTRVAPRLLCDELVTALCETVGDPKSQALAKSLYEQIHCLSFEDLQLLREGDLNVIKLSLFTRRKLWAKIGDIKNNSKSIARDSSLSAGKGNPGLNVNKPCCIISYRPADRKKLDGLIELTMDYGFEDAPPDRWEDISAICAGHSTVWISYHGLPPPIRSRHCDADPPPVSAGSGLPAMRTTS